MMYINKTLSTLSTLSSLSFFLQVESEMGVIGREVEKFFHNLVRRYLPYIDIQPVSSAGNTPNNATSAPSVSKGDENVSEERPPQAKLKKRVSADGDSAPSAPSSGSEEADDPSVSDIRHCIGILQDFIIIYCECGICFFFFEVTFILVFAVFLSLLNLDGLDVFFMSAERVLSCIVLMWRK